MDAACFRTLASCAEAGKPEVSIVKCPVPMCPKVMPRPGCKFVPSKEMDANGCPKHPCGKQECVKCPVPMCTKMGPKPGCKFVPGKEMDANGCPKHPCGKQECPVCPQSSACSSRSRAASLRSPRRRMPRGV